MTGTWDKNWDKIEPLSPEDVAFSDQAQFAFKQPQRLKILVGPLKPIEQVLRERREAEASGTADSHRKETAD